MTFAMLRVMPGIYTVDAFLCCEYDVHCFHAGIDAGQHSIVFSRTLRVKGQKMGRSNDTVHVHSPHQYVMAHLDGLLL